MTKLSAKLLMVLGVVTLLVMTNVFGGPGTWNGTLTVCKNSALDSSTVTIHEIQYGSSTRKFYADLSISEGNLGRQLSDAKYHQSGYNTSYPSLIKIKVDGNERVVSIPGFGSAHTKITLSKNADGTVTASVS